MTAVIVGEGWGVNRLESGSPRIQKAGRERAKGLLGGTTGVLAGMENFVLKQ